MTSDDEEITDTQPTWICVRLHSLAAHPELNGREGVVVSHDAQKGRFGVLLNAEQKPLALKADNLLPMALPAGTPVQLVGLTSQPELNGQECTVVLMDGDRFGVHTLAGKQLKVRAERLRLLGPDEHATPVPGLAAAAPSGLQAAAGVMPPQQAGVDPGPVARTFAGLNCLESEDNGHALMLRDALQIHASYGLNAVIAVNGLYERPGGGRGAGAPFASAWGAFDGHQIRSGVVPDPPDSFSSPDKPTMLYGELLAIETMLKVREAGEKVLVLTALRGACDALEKVYRDGHFDNVHELAGGKALQGAITGVTTQRVRIQQGGGVVIFYWTPSARGGLVKSPNFNERDYKCDVYKPSSFEMGPNGELLIHQPKRTAEDERALESKRCVWCAQYGVKTCALRHGADPYHAQGHPIQGPLPDFLSMA